MIGERTSSGLEIRFACRGPGRFLGAGFLGFWLCGWVAGECFALWMLARGATSALTGQPISRGGAVLAAGPALGIGLFLLVWLSFWTLGGVLAMRELLRLLWSEDRLTAHGGGLTIQRALGPFRSTREIRRDAIRDVLLVPRRGRLVARTDRGTVELTQLGSREERDQAATTLRAELGLHESLAATRLPKEWEEIITPEGERAVTPALGPRRAQARVATAVAMLFAAGAFMLAREAMDQLALVPGVILLVALTAGTTWGAVWLARGRMEWKIGGGRLTLRRRFGAGARDVFEARRLELSTTSDSDGDDWYHLDALASPDPGPATPTIRWVRGSAKERRRIASVMHDSELPRQLGAWLASATAMPLDDRSTPAAQAIELGQLREQLERSGAFGRIAARFLDRLVAQRGPKNS